MFRINYHILFLFLSFSLLAQNKEALLNEVPPPDWVSQRPVSSSKFIGIGVASKIGNPNYQFEAKKNALYDLTSEIKVNISSNSMLYSVQNDNKFSQTFNSLINLKSVENIEGYQLVGTYENDKQYWVYYELDKQEYFRQKEQKKKNTLSKAAEIIKLSQSDDQQKNYSAGLRKKIQAFSILVPYLNEEIDFTEYNIPNIKNIFDLTKDIQFKLQSIGIEPPKNTPVVKPFQQKYNPISVKTFIYKDPLTQFPFSCSYDDEIIQTQDKAVSNNMGILEITPVFVSANFQLCNIELQPDLEALMQNDSVSAQNVRFLKSFIQIPKFNVQVSIQPINIFIFSRELNLNKPTTNAAVKNILFNKLKTNEINVVSDSTQADYIVKVFCNTVEDENNNDLKKQFNLYLAQLVLEINLYNKEKQILYNQTINDVYGYGTTLQLAGSNAYSNEKLIRRLNEALFYLKRKIVWY
ncbi:MAG: hypothetical protein KatS3mg027_0060 [Bacteroidia bacterium]|nr:MAG: hypothetical protein KatS3mg027_0060 [Bacteroidia bacterium]